MRTFVLCAGVLGVLFFSGCGRFDLPELERQQRSQVKFSQALSAEQSGNLDEAIRLYKQVMIDEPKAYSAHFMLATLLHDHAEDYVGAIYHYRRYIELEPDSDKVELAEKRISIAEHLLAPQILKKVSDSNSGISQARLLSEISRLNNIITSLEGEKAKLNEQVQEQETVISQVSAENAQMHKIVDKIRDDNNEVIPEKPLKERIKQARESESTGSTGLSKSELDALRNEADAMREAKPSAPAPAVVKKPIVEVPSVKSVLEKVETRLTGEAPREEKTTVTAEMKKIEKAKKEALDKEARAVAKDGDISKFSLFNNFGDDEEKPTAEKKQTYVVQPGDTLMRISIRFYGDGTKWKRIRDANQGQIGPDGRVRAGQIISIP